MSSKGGLISHLTCSVYVHMRNCSTMLNSLILLTYQALSGVKWIEIDLLQKFLFMLMKIMKISPEDVILINKICICQRGMVHGDCCMNFLCSFTA